MPLPNGAVVKFPIVSESKSWEAEVTVLRREEMKTPLGRVQTIVLKPETKYQGVLQKRGDSFLWDAFTPHRVTCTPLGYRLEKGEWETLCTPSHMRKM